MKLFTNAQDSLYYSYSHTTELIECKKYHNGKIALHFYMLNENFHGYYQGYNDGQKLKERFYVHGVVVDKPELEQTWLNPSETDEVTLALMGW